MTSNTLHALVWLYYAFIQCQSVTLYTIYNIMCKQLVSAIKSFTAAAYYIYLYLLLILSSAAF